MTASIKLVLPWASFASIMAEVGPSCRRKKRATSSCRFVRARWKKLGRGRRVSALTATVGLERR